jgi:predicted ATPase
MVSGNSKMLDALPPCSVNCARPIIEHDETIGEQRNERFSVRLPTAANLFTSSFEQGIYVLDEPEAALSPQRQLSSLKIVHDLATPGHAQFLIATHSRHSP